jgi:chromosome segregation ATPase
LLRSEEFELLSTTILNHEGSIAELQTAAASHKDDKNKWLKESTKYASQIVSLQESLQVANWELNKLKGKYATLEGTKCRLESEINQMSISDVDSPQQFRHSLAAELGMSENFGMEKDIEYRSLFEFEMVEEEENDGKNEVRLLFSSRTLVTRSMCYSSQFQGV